MTTLVDFLVEPAQRKNNSMLLSAWKKKLPRGLLYFAKRNEMMNNICRIKMRIKSYQDCNSQTSVCDK